jgi:hypothetical protein
MHVICTEQSGPVHPGAHPHTMGPVWPAARLAHSTGTNKVMSASQSSLVCLENARRRHISRPNSGRGVGGPHFQSPIPPPLRHGPRSVAACHATMAVRTRSVVAINNNAVLAAHGNLAAVTRPAHRVPAVAQRLVVGLAHAAARAVLPGTQTTQHTQGNPFVQSWLNGNSRLPILHPPPPTKKKGEV